MINQTNDTIELFASIKKREENIKMLETAREKLRRREKRLGRLLIALLALLAVCVAVLYDRSLQPKAPVHKTADQHALDELFKTLPR